MARDASGAAIAFVTGDAVPPEIDIATAVAALATSLTVVCGWPQIRRLRRTGDVTGVSISTTALSVASEVGWLIYLAGERLWSALPEAMLTMVVNLVLTVVLLRAGSEWAVGVAAAGAWGIVLIGGRVVGGPSAIAVLLSVTYAVQLAPAVWTAWRAWCPSGVSAGAWTVRLTQSALWSGYGFMRDDPPLVTLGMIGSVASAAVLARLVVTRPRLSVAGLTVARSGSQREDREVMSTLKRLLSVLALAAIATFVSPSAPNADASPIAPAAGQTLIDTADPTTATRMGAVDTPPGTGTSANMPALGAAVAGAGVVIMVMVLVARSDARRERHDRSGPEHVGEPRYRP